jgi:hypothetical protein
MKTMKNLTKRIAKFWFIKDKVLISIMSIGFIYMATRFIIAIIGNLLK